MTKRGLPKIYARSLRSNRQESYSAGLQIAFLLTHCRNLEWVLKPETVNDFIWVNKNGLSSHS